MPASTVCECWKRTTSAFRCDRNRALQQNAGGLHSIGNGAALVVDRTAGGAAGFGGFLQRGVIEPRAGQRLTGGFDQQRRRRDGAETDARRVWQIFGDRYHLFRATPTAAWLDYQFHVVFGIHTPLDASTAPRIYDALLERLRSPEFRPRALFTRFNIEVLATTDAAADDLAHHRAIRDSGWNGRVIPTFRPDAVFRIASRSWPRDIARLAAKVANAPDTTHPTRAQFEAEVQALAKSLAEAADFHAGAAVRAAHAKIRERIAFMARDRAMDGDVKAICDIVREGILPTRRRDDR